MVDKTVSLGGVNTLDIAISKGVASLTATFAAPNAGLSLGGTLGVSMSASDLLKKLFAAVELVSPPGIVIFEESVKAMAIATVDSL